MIQRGLNDGEVGQLAAAGFTPALATAVAREAQTMRWLFLRRGVSGLWAAAVGIIVVVGAFFASWWFSDFGWLVTLAFSWLPVVQYAPHLEALSLKRSDPVRYAARTLAIMAVIAQRNPKPESNPQLRKLQTLAEGLDLLAHPHTQLRLLARAMDEGDDGAAGADRKSTGSGDDFGATLRFGLIILAIAVIIVTLALGARPF